MRIEFEGNLPDSKLADTIKEITKSNIFTERDGSAVKSEGLVIKVISDSGGITIFPSKTSQKIYQAHPPKDPKNSENPYVDRQGSLNCKYGEVSYKLRAIPPEKNKK